MRDLLEVIKSEFPDKAIDISESLQLLKESISSTMDDINTKLNEEFAERNFTSMEKYTQLAEKTHDYENKVEEVIDWIDMEDVQVEDEPDEETEQIVIPNYEEYIVDHHVEHTLYDDFTHKRPYGFKINNEHIVKAKTWKDMLIKTCELLISIDEKKFLNFENEKHMNGKKHKYFAVDSEEIRNPKSIHNKIYVETNQSANSIRNLIIKLLKAYNFRISEYKIFYRADYANMH